jgi:hypothetical protein
MRHFFNDFGVLKGAYVVTMLTGCMACILIGTAGWLT